MSYEEETKQLLEIIVYAMSWPGNDIQIKAGQIDREEIENVTVYKMYNLLTKLELPSFEIRKLGYGDYKLIHQPGLTKIDLVNRSSHNWEIASI